MGHHCQESRLPHPLGRRATGGPEGKATVIKGFCHGSQPEKGQPPEFLLLVSCRTVSSEQDLWRLWIIAGALEIQLIWGKLPSYQERQKPGRVSQAERCWCSPSKTGATYASHHTQSFILMTLKGRDENLQDTQIRRDIIDGEPKYDKSPTTLFTGRQSNYHHFLIEAIAVSYSKAMFL